MKSHPRVKLPVWAAILTALVLTGGISVFVLWLQIGPLPATFQALQNNPLLIALNLWPFAAMIALLFCLFGNLFYSAALTALVWSLLSYVNLIKVSSRGDPFVPGDVLLLGEGMEAAGDYSLDLHPDILVMIALLCLALAVLGIFVKSPAPRLPFRAIGLLAVAGAFALSMKVYPDMELYNSLEGPSRSNVPQVFDEFGFPYCFLHNFSLNPIDKPTGYRQSEAADYEQTYRKDTVIPEDKPNILMIMCEAFTDLPNKDMFTYSPQDNPIALYNALAADPNTVSGHLVVSNTGAGTANTEFDVLTGAMTNRLSPATTSAFRVVHRNTVSLPRALSGVGYRTFFMHPGYNWFYNRESVYSYLGVPDQVFREAFTADDFKGGWISDVGFLRVLKDSLESRTDPDSPLFTYAVTIQNHQAYTYGKYRFEPAPPKTDLPLSDSGVESLSVYFEGLRDGAQLLKDLTDYLNGLDEPYLLAFFGDHQPTLGANNQTYTELGLNHSDSSDPEELLSAYQTPFLLWANDAYRSSHDLVAQAAAVGLRDGDTISSHYLGAAAFAIAGFQGVDGYFDYLNDLRQTLPVDSVYGYRLGDGTYTDTLPEALQQAQTIRWYWQYYRLKTQRVGN